MFSSISPEFFTLGLKGTVERVRKPAGRAVSHASLPDTTSATQRVFPVRLDVVCRALRPFFFAWRRHSRRFAMRLIDACCADPTASIAFLLCDFWRCLVLREV